MYSFRTVHQPFSSSLCPSTRTISVSTALCSHSSWVFNIRYILIKISHCSKLDLDVNIGDLAHVVISLLYWYIIDITNRSSLLSILCHPKKHFGWNDDLYRWCTQPDAWLVRCFLNLAARDLKLFCLIWLVLYNNNYNSHKTSWTWLLGT